ncbi:energy-coupling factor transporter transmembrane component T [Fibrobacter sp.]|uniref:energy-coupling factor transporter transmembrane component T n=1 Tax=Fibrobacter sp. TaxID=35828 RepID=UPI003863B977
MKLDPRTKLFLVVAANTMIFSAPYAYSMPMVAAILVLLLLEKKWKFMSVFFPIYVMAALCFDYLKQLDVGMIGTLIAATVLLICRMMPVGVVFYYIMATTRANEFMAGMSKMHVPNKATIPLTVMIRFFPTVFDESRAISNAMKMRGIRLFSLHTLKNPLTILEYRLIPLLVSITKIGDELSVAASTRALTPEAKRTCIVPIGFHVQDFVVFAYCIAVVVLFLLRPVP